MHFCLHEMSQPLGGNTGASKVHALLVSLVRHLFTEPLLGGRDQSVDHGHAHVGLHLLCQPGAHIR